MNFLVTGSRDYKRLDFVRQVLWGIVNYPTRIRKPDETDRLYVGDARGVDRQAAETWREIDGNHGLKIYQANWRKHGLGAGPIRNAKMVEDFHKACEADGGGVALAFWDGKSKGTLHCMKELRKRGRMVLVPDGFQDLDKDLRKADLRLVVWEGQERLV